MAIAVSGKNWSVVKAEDVEVDSLGDGVVTITRIRHAEREARLACRVCCRKEGESAQLLEGKCLLGGDGSGAIGEIHDALGGIGQLGDGVGEGLISLIDAAANGVVEASEAHRCQRCILNQEEGGDVACSTHRLVIHRLNVERVCGKEVAALPIRNDVIQRDFAVEVRVGSEGVLIRSSDLADETIGSREAKDAQRLGFTSVRIGVTGEEITGGDGVSGVFRASDQRCFNARESRNVIDRSKIEGVGGIGGVDAIGDLVGEIDVAVEVLVGCERPAGFGGVQLKGAGLVALVIGGNEIGDVEGADSPSSASEKPAKSWFFVME